MFEKENTRRVRISRFFQIKIDLLKKQNKKKTEQKEKKTKKKNQNKTRKEQNKKKQNKT